MSELLQNWLNNEVGLSTNISNFERDFASGYLFGEILHKYRQQDDFSSFLNKSAYEAKIANFKRLEPTLKALGIKFNATQSNAIMNGERGASLRLLYQLKMATEKLLLASDNAGTQTKAETQGGGVIKGIRVPREKYDTLERAFFEHRLRATGVNVKQARLEKLTKKYEQVRVKQELAACEMDNIEQARAAEQKEIHRYAMRELLRQNKAAKEDWERSNIELWEQNMQRKAVREQQNIIFEARMEEKQKQQKERARNFAASEVHDGVSNFEAGLVDLGLRTARETSSAAAQRPPDEAESDSDSEEDAADQGEVLTNTGRETGGMLDARLPNSEEFEHEAGLFLKKIKESKRAGTIARRERERRRRRVLVEQEREQDRIEENKLEECILEKLSRESLEEQAISYSVWRTQRYHEVIIANRQLRQKEYDKRNKSDQQDALQADRLLLDEAIEDVEEQCERERVRYRGLERSRQAALRARLCEDCEGILELVSCMAFAALHQEQLTDSSEVDETLWREWMALFVESEPVAAPESLQATAQAFYPLTALPPQLEDDPDRPTKILQDVALRDYVDSQGLWKHQPLALPSAAPSTGGGAAAAGGGSAAFDAAAEMKALLEQGCQALSFAGRLSCEVDTVDGRPVNYRLGLLVASLLERQYPKAPQLETPPMPDVPVRLAITGKPFAGKRTLANRIAETYNLQVVDVDEAIRECLALSKRPDVGSTNPIDNLSFTPEMMDEECQRREEQGNPYVRRLQTIGYELQALLDAGEELTDELYVDIATTKIRSLFPDRMPALTDVPSADAVEAAAKADDSRVGTATQADDAPLADNDQVENVATSAEEALGSPISEDAQQMGVEDAEDKNLADPAMALDELRQDSRGSDDVEARAHIEPAGWVLVGFPDSKPCLLLLERFLSGWVEPSARPALEVETAKEQAALLAPRPPEQPKPFVLEPGGCDLHIRLDVDGNEAIRRAVGRRLDPSTNLSYHVEDAPPTTKRHLIFERLTPVDSLANSMGTLTQRIHVFDVAQPDCANSLAFFGPFPDVPRLVSVDANRTRDEMYDTVDEQVAMFLERKRAERLRELQAAKDAAAAAAAGAAEEAAAAAAAAAEGPADAAGDVKVEAAPEVPEAAAAPPPEVVAPAPEPPSTAGSKKGRKAGRKVSKDPSKDASPPGSAVSAAASQSPLQPEVDPALLAPVELSELPGLINELEENCFRLLLAQWQELQEKFSTAVQQLSSWHRQHLADFRGGMYSAQQCFVQFLQRPDDKQRLVDEFVWSFNDFSLEYPDMRKHEDTKEELHQRVDDLEELLRGHVEKSEAENLSQLEAIEKSQWVESHVEAVAAQAQHAVQLEADRYHAACCLLVDFYFAAMHMGLPPARAPLPKIDALALPQASEPSAPEPKKKGKEDKKKAKHHQQEEEAKPELTPEQRAANRLRKLVPGAVDADGNHGESYWEFPFLQELMSQANAVVPKLQEFTPPMIAEKPEPEAPADPKKKNAKDKGGRKSPDDKKGSKHPAEDSAAVAEVPTHRLYVDLQQALLAEQLTYTHRLRIIQNWTERRLTAMSTSVTDAFREFRDWVHFRKQKELDAIGCLSDVIKRHIESEELIASRIALEGAHLHLSPNVRLQAPAQEPPVPALEAAVPYRWTMPQLEGLLEAISLATRTLSPEARSLPAQVLMEVLMRLADVPAMWQGRDAGQLEKACALFDRTKCGTVDCVEFLLHICFLHNPLGWPSMEGLMQVRRHLEGYMPPGGTWPDFCITLEQLISLPIFVDEDGSEAELRRSFWPAALAEEPRPSDRLQDQLRWVGRVFQRFPAPIRQWHAWRIEAANFDYQARCNQENDRRAEYLEEGQGAGGSSPTYGTDGIPPLVPDTPTVPRDLESPDLDEPFSPTRPTAPMQLSEFPSAGMISVRQLLAYFCLAASPWEGLERSLAVLGTKGDNIVVSGHDVYNSLFQIGARPMPVSGTSDLRPRYPGLEDFCDELGLESPEEGLSLEDLHASPGLQQILAEGLGAQHCRADLARLFPKSKASSPARPRPSACEPLPS